MMSMLRSRFICKQQTTKWLNMRKKMLTASDVAAALGCNPYDSDYKLLRRKCSIDSDNIIDTRMVDHGNRYEDIMISIYKDDTNKKILKSGMYRHPDYSWLGATPDGICEDDNSLIEIKCPMIRSIYGKIPLYYWIQVQIQLEVCNIEKCNFIQGDIVEINEEEYNNIVCSNRTGIITEDNKVIYWKLNDYTVHSIYRDTEWFKLNSVKLSIFWRKVNYYKNLGNVEELLDNYNKMIYISDDRRSKRIRITSDVINNYYVTDNWVSYQSLVNSINNDMIVDWLDRYGEENGYFQDIVKNEFYNFVSNRKSEFHNYIISKIKQKYPGKYIDIGSKYEISSIDKANQTLTEICKSRPIIFNPILHDSKNELYGSVSLLMRNDYVKSLFNTHEFRSSISKCKNYHYVAIDIVFNTLDMTSDNIVKNGSKMKELKGKLLFCNKILSELQNVESPYSILIGRSVKKEIIIKNSHLQEIGIVLNSKNTSLLGTIDNMIEWIHDLNNNGVSWNISNPHRDELYPNMKNKSNRWNSVKNSVAEQIGEITLQYKCGVKHRRIAHTQGIMSYKDINFSSNLVKIKGNDMDILDNFKKLSENGYDFYPLRLSNNSIIENSNMIDFYVDFESVNNLNDNFNDTSVYSGIIYMIGIGHIHPNTNEWVYRSFVTDRLDNQSEKEIIHDWKSYINNVVNNYNRNKYRLYNWTSAENTMINNAIEKHNLPSKYIKLKWFDLHNYFKSNKIVIKNTNGYGLKNIASKLYEYGYIDTKWEDDEINGISASVTTWRCNDLAIANNNRMIDHNEMESIIKYNEVDCKAVCDILRFVRDN
jgi:putative phage-type endonuclease